MVELKEMLFKKGNIVKIPYKESDIKNFREKGFDEYHNKKLVRSGNPDIESVRVENEKLKKELENSDNGKLKKELEEVKKLNKELEEANEAYAKAEKSSLESTTDSPKPKGK